MLHDTSGQSPQSLMTDLGLMVCCTLSFIAWYATFQVAKVRLKEFGWVIRLTANFTKITCFRCSPLNGGFFPLRKRLPSAWPNSNELVVCTYCFKRRLPSAYSGCGYRRRSHLNFLSRGFTLHAQAATLDDLCFFFSEKGLVGS